MEYGESVIHYIDIQHTTYISVHNIYYIAISYVHLKEYTCISYDMIYIFPMDDHPSYTPLFLWEQLARWFIDVFEDILRSRRLDKTKDISRKNTGV